MGQLDATPDEWDQTQIRVFGIPKEEGEKITDQMKTTFLSQWKRVYLKSGASRKDLPGLAEAFVNHLR